MDALLLVARLVLAAVFTVAALSKLADRGDFAATVRESGFVRAPLPARCRS